MGHCCLGFNKKSFHIGKQKRDLKVRGAHVHNPDPFVSREKYAEKFMKFMREMSVKVAIAHNNWVVGRNARLARFKEAGLWFVGPPTSSSSTSFSEASPSASSAGPGAPTTVEETPAGSTAGFRGWQMEDAGPPSGPGPGDPLHSRPPSRWPHYLCPAWTEHHTDSLAELVRLHSRLPLPHPSLVPPPPLHSLPFPPPSLMASPPQVPAPDLPACSPCCSDCTGFCPARGLLFVGHNLTSSPSLTVQPDTLASQLCIPSECWGCCKVHLSGEDGVQ